MLGLFSINFGLASIFFRERVSDTEEAGLGDPIKAVNGLFVLRKKVDGLYDGCTKYPGDDL